MGSHVLRSIHVAVQEGNLDEIKAILARGTDVNEPDGSQNTPLHIALRKGYFDIAEYLMENAVAKADINAVTRTGETPLYIACSMVAVDMVKSLLQRGANVNAQLNQHHATTGVSPLMASIPSSYEINVKKRRRTDMVTIMKTLIDHGCDLDLQNSLGNTALHRAVDLSSPEGAALLADNGADLTIENKFGKTPFQLAVDHESQRYEMAIMLLLYGCLTNITPQEQLSVLECLHQGKTTPGFAKDDPLRNILLRLFIEEVYIKDEFASYVKDLDESLMTEISSIKGGTKPFIAPESLQRQCRRAIRKAIGKSMYKAVAKLPIAQPLKQYLVFNMPNPNRKFELFVAIKDSDSCGLQHLLEDFTIQELNLNIMGNESPLTQAAHRGDLPIFEMLLDRGANINELDNDGHTPLHVAACHGHLELVKLLIQRSCNINARNRNKETALTVAAENGCFDVVMCLLDAGCETTDLFNCQGYHALHFAAGSGNYQVTHALLCSGVSPDVLDRYGNTSLHVAASCGTLYINKDPSLLPALFVSKDSMNYEGLRAAMGRTPRADIRGDHVTVVQMLLDAGADKTLHNHDGWTAEQLASSSGEHNQNIFDLLNG